MPAGEAKYASENDKMCLADKTYLADKSCRSDKTCLADKMCLADKSCRRDKTCLADKTCQLQAHFRVVPTLHVYQDDGVVEEKSLVAIPTVSGTRLVAYVPLLNVWSVGLFYGRRLISFTYRGISQVSSAWRVGHRLWLFICYKLLKVQHVPDTQ